jgi:hypothetical protein
LAERIGETRQIVAEDDSLEDACDLVARRFQPITFKLTSSPAGDGTVSVTKYVGEITDPKENSRDWPLLYIPKNHFFNICEKVTPVTESGIVPLVQIVIPFLELVGKREYIFLHIWMKTGSSQSDRRFYCRISHLAVESH